MDYLRLDDEQRFPGVHALVTTYRSQVSYSLPSERDHKFPFALLLLRVFGYAVLSAAADIHLEFHERSGYKLNVSTAKGMQHISTEGLDSEQSVALREMITAFCNLNSSGDRADFNAALPVDFPMAWVLDNGVRVKEEYLSNEYYYIRFRVAYIRMTDDGYSFTFRIIDENRTKDLHELNFPYAVESEMRKLCNLKSGLILTCGPVASGKSSTQFAWLRIANDGQRKLIMVDDPTEFMLHGKGSIVHVEVTKDLSPERALEQALRMGGQVLVVGEIRSPRMLQLALSAATTGYLVFATLHCDTVTESIVRLFNLLPEQNREAELGLLSSALRAVVCQRLVPLREPGTAVCTPSLHQRDWIRKNSGVNLEHYIEASDQVVDRKAIAELMVVDYEIKIAIEEYDVKRVFTQAISQPQFETLLQQGLRLVEKGLVSIDDCERRLGGQIMAGLHPTLRLQLAELYRMSANEVDEVISDFYRQREANIPADLNAMCEAYTLAKEGIDVCAA